MSIDTASEGLFGHLARGPGKPGDQLQKGFVVYSNDTWTPNVNLYETPVSYFVCVDLAGVDKEKIDVEVADQGLTLKGSRLVPTPELPEAAGTEGESAQKRVRVHLMEIDHGTFTRVVELPPDANRDGITANYRQGMLWIEIPRT
jgi:HSP20 family protein